MVTKARRALARLQTAGIYPQAGSIVSGSGLAFGTSYRSPAAADTRLSAEAGAMWSIRGYREFHARVGWLADMRDTTQLEPPIAEIWGALNARATTRRGLAVFLDARRFSYGRMDYFGLNARSSTLRSDFALMGTGLDVVGQWQPMTDLGLSGRIGLLDLDVGPGTNDQRPDVADLFTESTAPGLTRHPRYRVAGLGAAWDRRDAATAATRGVYVGATISRFSALNDEAPTFTRATLDVRAFYPVVNDRHVVAVNVLASADRSTGASPTPFYLQSWLGGSHTLRSFSSARLRGESLAHTAVEYRWRAHRYVEIAPFADLGAASGAGSSLSDGPRYTALGAGIRFLHRGRALVRIDWAHGDEGHRAFFAMSPSF